MEENGGTERALKGQNRYPRHIFLFLVSLITTTIAGLELASGDSFFFGGRLSWRDLADGLPFSLSFLAFLTVHEFGHYFMAVYHRVKVSLPYYIPVFIPIPGMINIGSFGAVIRIRKLPDSRRKYFDIGVAGPLAGFVVALGLLVYGLLNLPPMEATVLGIHPDYLAEFGGVPTEAQIAETRMGLAVGSSLLFDLLATILPPDASQLPPSFEMMHYPYLFSGFLTLFFTALNLLPIGQLDGGHVIYGLFGKRIAGIVSRLAVLALVMVGGTGMMVWNEMDPAMYSSYQRFAGEQALGMLLYAGLVFFVVRRLMREWPVERVLIGTGLILLVQAVINLLVPGITVNGIWLLYSLLAVGMVGVDHPQAPDDTPLDGKRKFLAWLAIAIFILCFSPSPLALL